MKLIFDQLATINAEHIRVAQELQKRHEIVYWIRLEEVTPLDASQFPKTIFHNYHDAIAGVAPKEVDTSGFEPMSKDEIVALSPWESDMMSMMEKWHPGWSVNRRKEFYYELLRYWGGVLDTLKPDRILFNAPPHQMFNFVLYAIAKHRGIKTILFDVTFRHDRLLLYHDYKKGNDALAEASRRDFGDKAVALEDLRPHVQEYYERVSASRDPSPPYVREFMRLHEGWPRLWRRIKAYWPFVKDGSIFERAVLRVFKMIRPDLKDVYKKLCRDAELNRPFVYVPLHFQPECTTSPQGGIYVDQPLMIKTLAAALPEGWELYVKEHPAQWKINGGDFTAFRYPGFYEALAAIPGVRLVPIDTNTFVLGDNAKATATVSGTAAWEAVVRGKCALVFGYPWYAYAPGVIRVGSVEECRAALFRIARGEKPDRNTFFKYLALLDTVSFSGSLSHTADRAEMLDGEEQWEAMYRAITQDLTS